MGPCAQAVCQAPHHSIKLSAQARSESGSEMPKAAAVLRLTDSSIFEGCSTGKWVGMMSTLKGRIEAAESKAGIRRKENRINLFFIEGWPEDRASEFLKIQDTISADRTESSASFRRTMESRRLLR